MPETVTIQMKPEGLFRDAVEALPASNPLSKLRVVEKVYLRDLGVRELDSAARLGYPQAIYMEHWDGTSPPVDISVILDGLASNLNRGRVRFEYTSSVARSLRKGYLKALTDAGLFVIEGFDLTIDTINGNPESEYVLRDGSRSFTGPISGVDPTLDSHLATRGFVDSILPTVPPVLFAFDAASPLVLATVGPGDVLDEVEVVIDQEFDDVIASLRVGTPGLPDLVFSSGEIDPTVAAQYRSPMNHEFMVSDTIQMLISPGASIQGSGYVLLKIRRAN